MPEVPPLEHALQAMCEDNEIVLQAVAIVVAMNDEGEKYISHLRSTDLRTWEARGMVEDLRDSLVAGEVARMFDPDDD